METGITRNRHKIILSAILGAGIGLFVSSAALQAQTTPNLSAKARVEAGFQPWLQTLWPQAEKIRRHQDDF